MKEGRWWPLSVTWTRRNWRGLFLCLEGAQTTHGRKRLATGHFSEAHYKRWANLKVLPVSSPISSDGDWPSKISIVGVFSWWWCCENPLLFEGLSFYSLPTAVFENLLKRAHAHQPLRLSRSSLGEWEQTAAYPRHAPRTTTPFWSLQGLTALLGIFFFF